MLVGVGVWAAGSTWLALDANDGGLMVAQAHTLGFATADLYLISPGASSPSGAEPTVELELVLDVAGEPEPEVRRKAVVQRVEDEVELRQLGRVLNKAVTVLSLGSGNAAVDVLRVRIAPVDAQSPLRVSVGDSLEDLVLKVHRASTEEVQELLVPAGTTSVALDWQLGAAGPAAPPRAEPDALQASHAGNVTPQVSRPRSHGLTFVQAVQRGVAHILPKGVDHVVFILGLFFLSVGVRDLVVELTLFTLAHSITLALGAVGWTNVSPGLVEPLIALSILLVGLEPRWSMWVEGTNGQLPFGLTQRVWRRVLVFSFGLLHGLGFASAFGKLGAKGWDFLRTLLGFNLGVELGQLGVVLACLAVTASIRKRAWYTTRLVPLACNLVAVMGALWFLERVLA